MLITTIRVMSRTDTFVTEGRVLKGIYMSLVWLGHEPELHRILISMVGTELSKAITRIGLGV